MCQNSIFVCVLLLGKLFYRHLNFNAPTWDGLFSFAIRCWWRKRDVRIALQPIHLELAECGVSFVIAVRFVWVNSRRSSVDCEAVNLDSSFRNEFLASYWDHVSSTKLALPRFTFPSDWQKSYKYIFELKRKFNSTESME